MGAKAEGQNPIAMEQRPFPLNPAYLVREDGQISRNGKILKPCKLKRGGYRALSLWENNHGKLRPVHQIVALTFIGPRPEGCRDCAHNDGNKENNHWKNLRWTTRQGNEADKLLHGRSNRGERNGMVITSADTVRRIKQALKSGMRNRDVARLFQKHEAWIASVKTERIWKHIV